MKRFLLLVIALAFVLALGFSFFNIAREKIKQDFARSIPYPSKTPTPSGAIFKNTQESTSLFVPYWTLKDSSTNSEQVVYDEYIYFGIMPNKDGIDMKEQGAKQLDAFLDFVPSGKKKYLSLRMIDSDTNFAILKSSTKQNTIIKQTIEIAKDNKFDGIVLDLEVSAIPFESLVKQITDFTTLFYKQAKNEDLEFAITMYGDVFYRVRPFDVKALASQTDRVMIMAYDFSKARGNPGPNFPLHGSETYGYDLEKMTSDFSKVVPLKKITVIFGLFGYDWLVDNKEKTLQQAGAVTNQEVEKKFIESCQQKSCSFSRDSKSAETEIHYIDKEGRKHLIWFEDMDSVAAKKEFLKSRGISSFSYWAHSYF